MKSSKCQVVLLMYRLLMEKGVLSRNEVISENLLSDATFKRYISEIRCFLANFENDVELIYSKKEDAYRLVSAFRY